MRIPPLTVRNGETWLRHYSGARGAPPTGAAAHPRRWKGKAGAAGGRDRPWPVHGTDAVRRAPAAPAARRATEGRPVGRGPLAGRRRRGETGRPPGTGRLVG